MCGIAAITGGGGESLVREMMKALGHRGPDAAGFYSAGAADLGHRRLSIMDPAGGNQPILSEDSQTAVIANGEIYNFSRLQERLSDKHVFSTTSDSEILLHMFEELGCKSAAVMDGMFACVISSGKHLFAARDVVGIKPLYYGTAGRELVFASELKALSGFAGDIKEFQPGTYYSTSEGFKQFGKIPYREPEELSLGELCKNLRSSLTRAVKKRLMSDVPLGAFLSGGLDSSIITAIARRYKKKLHTFSVGFEGSPDLLAARKVANCLDTVHHEHVITQKEVLRFLPKILYHLESFDQDLVRSAVPCFFVSRLASDYVKVILTGEGADELFGGYDYYKDISDGRVLQRELYRSVSSLHNINLQRVDRMTMAHSIEGRVPFLDLEVIEMAQKIPLKWKLMRNKNPEYIEKWILRKAFEDYLPGEILWRGKEQFDVGSGSTDFLSGIGQTFVDGKECRAYERKYRQHGLRSHEEIAYHSLLSCVFSKPEAIYSNVGRWKAERINAPGIARPSRQEIRATGYDDQNKDIS